MEVLICGASGRAAAFSAARAGLKPSVVDLFADSDLAALCPAQRIPAHVYPAGVVEFLESRPPSPWLYTGALENHPDVVDAIARRHRLIGNGGAALRPVRDPFQVAELLRRGGLPCPEVRCSADGLSRDGRWLVKPLASGGGLGIVPLIEGVALPADSYLQERVDGASFSAVYVAHGARCRLAGVTRQLVGRPGAPFVYVGSVGPWPVDQVVRERLARLGTLVGEAFGLVGLFGIDFILHDRQPWPVEINPRYTASVEVLELATGTGLLAEHVRAALSQTGAPHGLWSPLPVCGEGVRERGRPDYQRRWRLSLTRPLRVRPLPEGEVFQWSPLPVCGERVRVRGQPTAKPECADPSPPPAADYASDLSPPTGRGEEARVRVVGKAVVYADHDSVFPQLRLGTPAIADVPVAGTPIRAGEPVLTVFASGRTTGECMTRLERRRQSWARRLRAF